MQDKYADVFEDRLGTFKTAKANYLSKKIAKLISAKLVLCLVPWDLRLKKNWEDFRMKVFSRTLSGVIGQRPLYLPQRKMDLSGSVVITKARWTQNNKLSSIPCPAVKISLQSLPGQNFSQIDLRQAYHKLDGGRFQEIPHYQHAHGSVLAQQTWYSASHQHLLSGSAPLVKCWKEHLAQAGKDNEEHMANLEKSCDGFRFMGWEQNKAKFKFSWRR